MAVGDCGLVHGKHTTCATAALVLATKEKRLKGLCHGQSVEQPHVSLPHITLHSTPMNRILPITFERVVDATLWAAVGGVWLYACTSDKQALVPPPYGGWHWQKQLERECEAKAKQADTKHENFEPIE